MKLAKESKIFIIVIITIGISLFHLTALHSQMGAHMVHRELFFIPIVLACFWFGLKPGLISAGVISFIYVSKALLGPESQMPFIPTLFQVFTFGLIAMILGTLVNHNEKVHEENIRKKELSALGNAALNLGKEIQDVSNALRNAFSRIEDESLGKDEIEEGFDRLDSLVKILTSFVSDDTHLKIDSDINLLVKEQLALLKEKMDTAGLSIETQMDEKGCPSKVSEESTKKLVKDLIVNAIEASSKGGKITIRTSHRPTYNIIEIEDTGAGIKPEHLKKIFRPFFTTKDGSHGLSLASDYKFIQSCGGDLDVSSTFGQGTTFKIKIPIDDPSKPVSSQKQIADWNPDKK
jgi:signal transduction histidine kinase